MKTIASLAASAALILATGCSTEVDLFHAGSTSNDSSLDGQGGSAMSNPSSVDGTPCSYLHGEVTLLDWKGNQDDGSYNESLYSFEYASKSIDVNHNDGDILYEQNMFFVNTVTDDQSFIVDLGDVALTSVPKTVDPTGYPTGNWGEHDAIQAVLDHTYMVHTNDGNTHQWAAFRVIGLAPGDKVTLDWLRSTNPDELDLPTQCL